jgi:hypothetical protein
MSKAQSERSQVTIRIDPLTRQRLEREAAADRRPVASLARLLIVDALRDVSARARGRRLHELVSDRQSGF